METFGATAYTDTAPDERRHLKNLPDQHGLRIDLDYPDGGKTVLLCDTPPHEQEERDLMLKLQMAAGAVGFTVTRIEADGTKLVVPALR
jgi:hypothetical protein